MYLVYAVVSCLLFASGGIIRKYQGTNVFIANSFITIAFLTTAIIHFMISAISKRAKGEKYLFPW